MNREEWKKGRRGGEGPGAESGRREQSYMGNEQAQVSLKLKQTVDARVGRTFAVRIERG